jgi:hypothetical protein
MDCFNCETKQIKEVPLLKCGCYICPDCYCRLKNTKIEYCLICHKILRRSSKKNKLAKTIYELNMSYC